MLMIRFQRIGRTNDPAFRIVVLEHARAAKTGRIVEQVGTYNPKTKAVTLNTEAIKGWLSKGAQATGSVHNLLVSQKVLEGKKVNVLPKKTVPEKEEATPAEAAPAAEAPAEEASAPAEEAAAPTEEAPAEEAKPEEAAPAA